jgi:hypothetical protein
MIPIPAKSHLNLVKVAWEARLSLAGITKRFFFEKKNQKTFDGCRGLLRDSRAQVFASFFKEAFGFSRS